MDLANIGVNEFVRFSSDDEDVNLDYLYRIGLLHEKKQSPRDAIFYFDKVLLVQPDHLGALAHKGNSMGKLGRYDEAILCYDMVLGIKYDEVCMLNRGLALHYLGKYDDAVLCYQKILDTTENPNVAYHMACTKALQGQTSQALEWLEKAVRADSKFAQQALADIDFASMKDNIQFKSLVS